MELDRFLGVFSQEDKSHIIEFCKTLSLLDVDVFILMARKSACFIDCLKSLELVNLDGYITTERVLDLDCSWLKGQRVCIVDDTIISGTTIRRTIDKLEGCEVSSIVVQSISINTDWFDSECVNNKKTDDLYLKRPYLNQNNKDSINQCKNIVDAISLFPRPYDVDFPYSKNLKLKNSEVFKIKRVMGFDIFNISTDLQRKNNVNALTFIPNEYLLRKLDKAYGNKIIDFCRFKIRAYFRSSESSDSTILRLVPIAIIDPIMVSDVDRIFDDLFVGENLERSKSIFVSPKSKFRLLQFLLADLIGNVFSEELSFSLERSEVLDVNRDCLDFIFTSEAIEFLFELKDKHVIPNFENATQCKKEMYPDGYFIEDFYADSVEEINDRINSPFLWLYNNWEIPTRKKIKDLGYYGYLKEKESDITLERLNIGFSFFALYEHVKSVTTFDMERYLSSYLDRIIDLGIAVPVTIESEGFLYRGFRHGEDVVFGEQEERLCALMLNSYSQESDKEYIPKIETHKALVLLLQIGARQNDSFLSLYDKSKGYIEPSKIASVKYYLHGPVVVTSNPENDNYSNKPYLSSDYTYSWLASSLSRKKKVLSFNSQRKGYKVENIPSTEFSEAKEIKVVNIGKAFGKLSVEKDLKGNRLLSDNDLVTLTACIDGNSIIAALSAEIYIFVNNWDDYILDYDLNDLSIDDCVSISETIRLKKNRFFTALHSGSIKFRRFINNEADTVINKVKDFYMSEDNTSDYERWLSLWPKNTCWNESNVEEGRWGLIVDMGIWIYTCLAYLSVFEYLCLVKSRVSDRERIEKSIGFINLSKMRLAEYSHNKRTSSVLPYLERVLPEILASKYLYSDSKMSDVVMKINSLIYKSTSMLENSEMYCSEYGKQIPIVDYSYAVLIQPVGNQDDQVSKKNIEYIEDVIHRKVSECKKGIHGSFEIDILPRNKNNLKSGVVVINSGNANNSFSINFAVDVCSEINQKVEVRSLVFAQIPKEARIKYIGLTHNSIKSGHFWKHVDKILGYLDTKGKNSKIFVAVENSANSMDEYAKISVDFLSKVEGCKHVNDIEIGNGLRSKIKIDEVILKDSDLKDSNGGITINGNVSGSIISRDVSNSEITQNHSTSTHNSADVLTNYLLENGVNQSDIDELINILNESLVPSAENEFNEETQSWVSKMVSKALDGTWNVGIATAGNVLGTAINTYFGFS